MASKINKYINGYVTTHLCVCLKGKKVFMAQYKCATPLEFPIFALLTLCLRDLIEGVFKFNGIWPKFCFVRGELKIGKIQFKLG